MSGFFAIRRDRFEKLAPELSTRDSRFCSTSSPPPAASCATREVPFTFGTRLHGESKLDSMVALDFLGLVLAKLTGDVISLRFILFGWSARQASSCI